MNLFEQILTGTLTLPKGYGTDHPGIKASVSDKELP